MQRFRSPATLQKSVSVHAAIYNHSHGEWLVKARFSLLRA